MAHQRIQGVTARVVAPFFVWLHLGCKFCRSFFPDLEYPSEMQNERGRRLREFLREEVEMFEYWYDFGDNWEHDVVIVRIVTGAEVMDARCLEGERSCPPGDVGSPSGYIDYLEALKDPSHPDHQQMVEWRGPWFDPERFDPKRINRRLSQLSRSRRRI